MPVDSTCTELSKVSTILFSEVNSVNNPCLPAVGDASMTRADAFFGDNHSFNQTLFDKVRPFSLALSPEVTTC